MHMHCSYIFLKQKLWKIEYEYTYIFTYNSQQIQWIEEIAKQKIWI
jgi:hypothetical protein